MGRYFDAIEADFAREYPGIDPGALWRSRQWRKLLNLIDHLPFGSYYWTARLNDPDEVARMGAADDGEKRFRGHPVYEATPEVRELRRVRAEIERLNASVLSFAGGKPGKPTPDFLRTAVVDGGAAQSKARARLAQISASIVPKPDPEGTPPQT